MISQEVISLLDVCFWDHQMLLEELGTLQMGDILHSNNQVNELVHFDQY